jgi:hypothetical protein
MEILFSYEGKLYRIDGYDPDNRGVFWAEEIVWAKGKDSYEASDNYERFDLKDLMNAQAEAVLTATTFNAVDE